MENTVLESEDRLTKERHALEHCIQKLTNKQRKLIELAYQAGVKKHEIASQLGWTPMALYKKLHRIRLQLMECIRKKIQLNETS